MYCESGSPPYVHVPPPALEVTVPITAYVVDVMEQAIKESHEGMLYEFTATYSKEPLGFYLNKLNGTAGTDPGVTPIYYWALYLDGIRADEGMSDEKIECVSNVSWRYMEYQPVPPS